MISPLLSQKQLDSIYYIILDNNNEWVNNFRRTYTYGQNTQAETTSSYFVNLQKFVPSNYYLYTYSPTCNNSLIQRDNNTYTNGVLEKNISIYYDRNSDCYIEKQRTIRFDGVTTLSYDYLNLDSQGNAGLIKYFRFDPNNSNVLVLDFEDLNTYIYDNNNKVTSITTNRKRNGVTGPWSKVEYKYTNTGKVENIIFYFYDTPTSKFKRSLEDLYEYKSQLEIFTRYTYNNPTSSAQVLSIDSTFFDNDNDIIQIKSLSYVLNGSPRYSKADYYYTNKKDEDKDGFDVNIDCDDKNSMINPDAIEICDAIDNNCDGNIDNGLQTFTYYIDTDSDGYGISANPLTTCLANAPSGYANKDLDCDDNNPTINPASAEACDNLDNNCNGVKDDGLQTFTYYIDADGDGYGILANSLTTCLTSIPSGYANNDLDCNDANSLINPTAKDIANNGIDEDCNGVDLITSTNEIIAHQFIIYPNPIHSILHINNNSYNNFTLKLKTLTSKEIMIYQNPSSIDLSTLKNGIYILQFILDGDEVFQYKKIIVQH